MSENEKEKEVKEYCYFCGSPINYSSSKNNGTPTISNDCLLECPLCGKYHFTTKVKLEFAEYRNETAYYLYHHNKFDDENNGNRKYIKLVKSINKKFQESSDSISISLNVIISYYPQNFSEKIENCILSLISKAEMPGNKIEFSNEELATICCVKRSYKDNGAFDYDNCFSYIKAILSYLKEQDYIDNDSLNPANKAKFELKHNLWLKAEQLQLINKNNKNVFIAMSFDDTDDLKSIRSAIERAISDAKFDSKIMDKIIHNEQIVPYMLKLIRDSRFMIMETTHPNMGAYFEAGYAEGLGKQVIVCCRKTEFDNQINNTDQQKEKSIHFDIAQKQLLIWDNYEDLTNKLKQWIEALF